MSPDNTPMNSNIQALGQAKNSAISKTSFKTKITAQRRMRLYSEHGQRFYLNANERQRFLEVALRQPRERRLFCLYLFYTGCRLSEACNLKPCDIQEIEIDGILEGKVAIQTLKKRVDFETRELPIPYALACELTSNKQCKNVSATMVAKIDQLRIWPVCRTTAWRWVKAVMGKANISGSQATAKGLRHSFGVCAGMNNIPGALIQRWMGHSNLATTSIYMNIIGKEELLLAGRMWQKSP